MTQPGSYTRARPPRDSVALAAAVVQQPEPAPLRADDPRRVGPYRITAALGAGGMGRVYLGESRDGRLAAVKVIHAHYGRQEVFQTRFGRELRAAAAIDSRYAPRVPGSGISDAPAWIATEYLPHLNLAQAVERFGPLLPVEAAALAALLGKALAAVHAAGLVHRGLKPSDVMHGGRSQSAPDPARLDQGTER